MKVQKHIEVRLLKKRLTCPVIDVVQYDTGVQLVFSLVDFDIPSGTTATLYVQKRSGKFVYQEKNITVSGNQITIDLENQALTEHGETKYQITLKNGTDTVTTFAGVLRIEKSLADANAVESKTVVRAFDEAVAEHVAEFQARAEQIVQACIATIPEDYAVMEAKVNELANAVKGNLSGTVVFADDVSPVKHNLSMLIHGKNRFFSDEDMAGTLSGMSYSIPKDTSTFTLNGTATTENALAFPDSFILEAGTYTASVIGANIHASGGNDRVFFRDIETNEVIVNHVTETTPRTFTLRKKTPIRTYFVFKENSAYSNQTISIQIEKGDTATEYEPYIDPSTVTVKRCGKNMVTYPYNEMGKTRAGVTFTVADDGKITANGTSTGAYLLLVTAADKALYLNKDQTYFFSCVPSGGGYETYYAYVAEDGGATFFDHGNGVKFTPTKSGYASVTVVVKEGVTASNVAFKPMLEVGESATAFEPYIGVEYVPTSDGTVSGVTSVSPNMTILTDTEGAIVECEYNRDTNKVIEKLTNAIIALGGTV